MTEARAAAVAPHRPGLSLRAGAVACGAVLWAVAMAASGAISVWRLDWQDEAALARVALLFFLGGVLAYPPAVLAARVLTRDRPPETRFSAMLVGLAAGTIGATALLFGLFYRVYYSHWHGEAFTIVWIFQFAFTVAAAVYHFLVLGLRMYLPVGLPALFAFSLWQARCRR